MQSLIQIVMDELFGVNILTGSLSYKSYKQLGSLNAWRMAFHPNDPIGDKGWPLRGLGYGCTYAIHVPYLPPRWQSDLGWATTCCPRTVQTHRLINKIMCFKYKFYIDQMDQTHLWDTKKPINGCKMLLICLKQGKGQRLPESSH